MDRMLGCLFLYLGLAPRLLNKKRKALAPFALVLVPAKRQPGALVQAEVWVARLGFRHSTGSARECGGSAATRAA
jgi:hypothetical protein